MQEAGWTEKKYLIDGFPRNQDNVDGWDNIMGNCADLKFILFLECTEDMMVERALKRAEEAGEDARNDDNEETLRKRYKVFEEQTMPIVEFYEKQS